MKNLLKWGLIGALAAAVLAAVIFYLPSSLPIDQREGTQLELPADVKLDLAPMPQMSSVRGDSQLIEQDDPAKDAVPVAEAATYPMEESTPPPPLEDSADAQKPIPPAQPEDPRPAIAIIIDDMGLRHALSARATKLPAAVTLAYLPYAPDLKLQTEYALRQGHDLMLHFPMEPQGKQNPGPNALRTTQTPEQWEKLIKMNLDSFDKFKGVNNHMGSKFTMDGKGLAFVAHELSKRGLFFIDSYTIAGSVAAKVMKVMNVKSATRDVFLDHVVEKSSISKQLARAERIAREKGSVIVIGHPHKATLSVLEEWVQSPEFKEFRLVPVRKLVK